MWLPVMCTPRTAGCWGLPMVSAVLARVGGPLPCELVVVELKLPCTMGAL